MYVDGFIAPIPRTKLAECRKRARVAAKVWREHGALSSVEAIADDVPVWGGFEAFIQR